MRKGGGFSARLGHTKDIKMVLRASLLALGIKGKEKGLVGSESEQCIRVGYMC